MKLSKFGQKFTGQAGVIQLMDNLGEALSGDECMLMLGEYFFPSIDEPWSHKYEYIRVNYAQEEAVVNEAISIIAEEVKKAYVA